MKRYESMVALLLGSLAAMTNWVGSAQAQSGPASPQGSALILIDRSGSMSETVGCPDPASPIPKWQCGINKAKDFINSVDLASESTEGLLRYDIWEFRVFGTDYANYLNVIKTNVNRTDALAALTAYQGPVVDDARTPLAGAACDGIRFLKNTSLPDGAQRYLVLESDGLENETLASHDCADIHSTTSYAKPLGGGLVDFTYADPPNNTIVATANALLVPTWDSNMLGMAISGALSKTPNGSTTFGRTDPRAFQVDIAGAPPMIAEIDFFDNFIGGTAIATSGAGIGVDRSASAVTRASTSASTNPNDPLAALFAGLADVSGGRLTRWRLDGAGVPGEPSFPHVIAGDVDDNACVNQADLSLLLAVFGQKVSSANPATYRADVTRDGIIDVRDYQLVIANWGSGCATTPPAAALPAKVLFGFEDRTKWSCPNAALAGVMVPKSEGSYALKVAGTGWREISSASFSTADLQGVTSKLAYDVYIPANLSNPYWLGQTLLFASCPSANIYNQAIGTVEFAGKPLGRFSTVQFTLPSNVRQALTTAHSDFSFKIAVNANDPGYALDAMRFVP